MSRQVYERRKDSSKPSGRMWGRFAECIRVFVAAAHGGLWLDDITPSDLASTGNRRATVTALRSAMLPLERVLHARRSLNMGSRNALIYATRKC